MQVTYRRFTGEGEHFFLHCHCPGVSLVCFLRWFLRRLLSDLNSRFVAFHIEEFLEHGFYNRCSGRAAVTAVLDKAAHRDPRFVRWSKASEPGVSLAAHRRSLG